LVNVGLASNKMARHSQRTQAWETWEKRCSGKPIRVLRPAILFADQQLIAQPILPMSLVPRASRFAMGDAEGTELAEVGSFWSPVSGRA
jgi:hypothetical protein